MKKARKEKRKAEPLNELQKTWILYYHDQKHPIKEIGRLLSLKRGQIDHFLKKDSDAQKQILKQLLENKTEWSGAIRQIVSNKVLMEYWQCFNRQGKMGCSHSPKHTCPCPCHKKVQEKK